MIDWPAILSTPLRRRTRCHRRVSTAFFLRVGLARYGCRTSHPEADNAGRSGSRSCRGWSGHCRAGGFGEVTPALLGPHCQGASARAAEKAFPRHGHSASGSGQRLARPGTVPARGSRPGLMRRRNSRFARLIALLTPPASLAVRGHGGATADRLLVPGGRSPPGPCGAICRGNALRRFSLVCGPRADDAAAPTRSVSQRRRGAVASGARGDGPSLVRHSGRGEGGQGAGRPPRKGAASKLSQPPRQDRHLRDGLHGGRCSGIARRLGHHRLSMRLS